MYWKEFQILPTSVKHQFIFNLEDVYKFALSYKETAVQILIYEGFRRYLTQEQQEQMIKGIGDNEKELDFQFKDYLKRKNKLAHIKQNPIALKAWEQATKKHIINKLDFSKNKEYEKYN